jgi:hypothetical protein
VAIALDLSPLFSGYGPHGGGLSAGSMPISVRRCEYRIERCWVDSTGRRNTFDYGGVSWDDLLDGCDS